MSARPFVKAAGGKTSLLPELLELVPDNVRTYYEPFVGGGALFFALKAINHFDKAVLNDTNARLMATYRGIEEDVVTVIRRLQRMKNESDYFYRVRAKKIDATWYNADIAAWFIYLNKTCYNGLYRVNKQNGFNVPFGGYKNPKICDDDNLRLCAWALRKVKFHSTDFVQVSRSAKAGDFVYFDPPYYPRIGNEFVAYGPNRFDHADQERLRDHALELKARGVNVLLSNSGAEPVRELYKSKKFKIHEVQGARTIGASGHSRGSVPDLLIQ